MFWPNRWYLPHRDSFTVSCPGDGQSASNPPSSTTTVPASLPAQLSTINSVPVIAAFLKFVSTNDSCDKYDTVAGLGCYRHSDCFACCKHCASVDFFCHLATIKCRRLCATLRAVPRLPVSHCYEPCSFRERFVHCKLTVKLTDAPNLAPVSRHNTRV